jgi:hypothetical protein
MPIPVTFVVPDGWEPQSDSINSPIVFVGGDGDTTIRPTPDRVRKDIELHRPWLLKPLNATESCDGQTSKINDISRESPNEGA